MATIIGIVCLSGSATRHPDSLNSAYAAALRSVDDIDPYEQVKKQFEGGILGARSWNATDELASAVSDEWICMADARIDNAEELARQLGTSAPGSSARNAAALILAAYRAWGERGFSRITGDFAAVVYNARQRELVLARDIIGARALFVSIDNDCVLVSTELRAVVAMRGGKLSLDPAEVVRMLQLGGSGAPRPDQTVFSGIERIAPGTCAVWSGTHQHSFRYWDPRLIRQTPDRDVADAAHELHDRIVSATVRRTRVVGPVAAHLSGGLDSSTIAAILQVHCPHMCPAPTYFSWTPRNAVPEGASELNSIDALASRYQISPFFVDGRDLDELRANPPAISRSPLYPWNSLHIEQHVQRRAQMMGVRHLISGWGGDEAASHQGLGLEIEQLLGLRPLQLFRTLADGCSPSIGLRRWRALLGRAKRTVLKPLLVRLVPKKRFSVASAALRGQYAMKTTLSELLQDDLSVRDTQLARYFDGYLTDRIESWYCHGKRHGLTYSYPLLDRDVLELVYSLPGRHFLHRGVSRYVFRRAVDRYWPNELVWADGKQETGLKGYFAAMQRSGLGGLREGLVCFSGDPRVSRWFDHAALELSFARAVTCGSTPDLELIARSEDLANLVMAVGELT